jgi:hypothetical protein
MYPRRSQCIVNVPARSIPWKAAIADLLLQDPDANAPVIAQRLKPLGYDGGFTIKDCGS